MGEEHLYSRRSTHRRVWTGQDGSELSDDRFTFVNARVISRFEFIKTTTREQSELRMGQSELRGVKANAHGSRRDQSHRKGDHTAFHVGVGVTKVGHQRLAARERGPAKRGVGPLRIARVMRDVGREGAPSRAHLRGQRPTPPTLE